MHPALYVLLIAGGALAHYRAFEARNLLDTDEVEIETDIDGVEIVKCPVCNSLRGWQASNEVCPMVRDGKEYKRCRYGGYKNAACNRRDCYRGPGEKCREKMAEDGYDQRCAPGYYCNPLVGICTGTDFSVDSNAQWFVNPNVRYTLADHRPKSDLSYPIRSRRHV